MKKKPDPHAETDRIKKPEPVTILEVVTARESVAAAFDASWFSSDIIPPIKGAPVLGWDGRHSAPIVVYWHRVLGTTGGFGVPTYSERFGISLKYNPDIVRWRELT
jgi:hypothetical protein